MVNADLAVTADGQECSLTQGDVITRLTDTPDADQKVNVSIASSKKQDCEVGKTVAVAVDDDATVVASVGDGSGAFALQIWSD